MKDLKHLIYFESLLENANNELVQKAQAEGNLALGYTCYHVPEALLNVGNCFSVRLRAPHTGSIDIATYYMSNYTCEFARALVERGIEGGYQFLDAMIGVDACSMMNRAMEHFEILKVNEKPNFFVTHCDIPYKITDYTLDSYVKQMRIHVLDKLTEVYGVDTSDAAIRQAVAEHNEVCSIISEMAEMRKAENPVITGYEFHVINLVSYTCPKALILPYLRETLKELKKRKPDEKVHQRRETADRLAKEYNAEGIIYEQMKYCDYWGFERALVSHIMHDEYGWPVLSIDRLYNNGNSGQLRTRVQAFVESLEIKRIHKEEGKA